MRLMFVITDLIVAGAQFQVYYLARYFRALGWDVQVVSMVDDAFNFLVEYDLYHEDKKNVFKSVIFLIKALFSV